MNSQWISKEEAGVRLSPDRPLSPRRVLELAKEGKLASELVRDPNNGQMVTRINAGSVERFIDDRNTIPEPAVRKPGEVREPRPSQTLQVLNLLERVREGCADRTATARLWLTIDAAAEYSGLGVVYLKRQIADGKLPLLKGAGIRGADVVRRADLERL